MGIYSLNEITLYKNHESKFSIGIFARDSRPMDKDPYFKVYNNSDYTKATHCIRISMLEPKYYYHQADNKKQLILNNSDKELLIKILLSKPTLNSYSYCNTVWEALCVSLESRYNKPYNLQMPNYMLLPTK